MGGVEYSVAPLIYDSAKYMSRGVESHFRWCGEWYGRDLDVAHTISLMASEARPTQLIGNTSDGIVLLLDSSERVADAGHGISIAVGLAQLLVGITERPRLRLVSSGSQVPTPTAGGVCTAGAGHAGVWGLGRTLRSEHPILDVCSNDVQCGSGTAAKYFDAMLSISDEREATLTHGMYHTPRLRPRAIQATSSSVLLNGVWLITGGLGGLGLCGAGVLLSSGATWLVLCSRTGRVAREGQGLARQLHALGSVAWVVACDGGDKEQVAALGMASSFRLGVLHTAGVLEDHLFLNMKASFVGVVIAPKVSAACHLHSANAQAVTEALVLFSSSAATFGSAGQSNYAAASSVLDSLALCRRCGGIAASSLQPQNVSGMGMAQAANDVGRHHRVWSLGLKQYVTSLALLLASTSGVHLPLPIDLAQMAADFDTYTWDRMKQMPLLAENVVAGTTPAPGFVSGPVAATVAGSSLAHSLAQLAPAQRRDHVEAAVLRIVRELTATPADTLTAETPLMEAGVDSLSATELSSRLRALTGVPLSPTIVFEQPTPRAVAEHLLEQAVSGVVVGGLPAHMASVR